MRWALLLSFLYASIYATTIGDFFAIDPKLNGAIIGIYIEDAKTQEEAFSYNENVHFQLASLTKLPTAYAAIKKLGNTFRYETKLAYTGTIDKNGKLNGDIIIIGGGDPTLSLDVIPEWGFAIKKKGIHSIAGRVIADASCFETLSASPHWEYLDLGNYYAAGASGLSINQNAYTVTFRPGAKVGDKADVVQIHPVVSSLTVSNEMKTGPEGSGDQGYIYGSEYSPLQIYRGTIPAGVDQFSIRGALPDPARFCAETLSRHLQLAAPIKVIRKKTTVFEKREVIFSKYSPPLNQIVREMLQSSNNLYAEHLLKTLGGGEREKGLNSVKKALRDVHVELYLKDGCGAARTNFGSPKNMVHLIRHMRQDSAMQEIIDVFPERKVNIDASNHSGTYGVRIFGKTGSMSGVSNLVGFITFQDGRSYNFCICINNFVCNTYHAKQMLHDFLARFIEEIF